MDGFRLTARLLLAGVFALAGLAKLADRSGARKALREFGVPAPLAAPLGGMLPLAELAAAAALVPLPSAWFGAVGALALLLLFVVAIGINLALGRTPSCHCFGQLASAPAGWGTLVRNAVLAGAAWLIVWQGPAHPGASAVSWVGVLSVPQRLGIAGAIIGVGVLALEAWLLWQLLRQQGRLLLRLDAMEARLAAPAAATAATQGPAAGLPVGAPAPDFRLVGLPRGTVGSPLALGAGAIRALVGGAVGQPAPVLSGGGNGSAPPNGQAIIPVRAAPPALGGPAPALKRRDLQGKLIELSSFRGSKTLVLFWNPDCGFCQQMLGDLKAWEAQPPPQAPKLLVVSTGSVEQNRALGLRAPVLLDHNLEAGQAFGASGTPMAVLVDAEGRIASSVAAGAAAVLALAGRPG